MKAAILADRIPTCDSCSTGVIKPDVVFFGEDLPDRFKKLLETDFDQCDLLIVIGTSLKVQPFCSLAQRAKQTTPRLLVRHYCSSSYNGCYSLPTQINKERVGNFVLASEGGYRDMAMIEECDQAVRTICKLCNWTQELDQLVEPRRKQAASDPKKKSQSPHPMLQAKQAASDPQKKSQSPHPTPQAKKTMASAHPSARKPAGHATARTKTAFDKAYAPKTSRK